MPPTTSHVAIRRILLALLWVGVAYVAWTFQDSFKPASDEHFEIACLIWISIVAPVFIAIGALFGRARLGATVGLIATVGFCAWAWFALEYIEGV